MDSRYEMMQSGYGMYGMPPFDPAYATAYDDPFEMQDPQELDMRRARQNAMLDERAANPDRFWWVRSHPSYTPPAQIEYQGYATGVGESEYPTVMGRHTEAFAEEMGLPFEHEDPRINPGPDDLFSNLYPASTPFQTYVNETPHFYGAFDQDNRQMPFSMLTQPVSNNIQREGYPEGAIDYVANVWGMNELDLERDSYRRIQGDRLTDDYIVDRNAGLDPYVSDSSPWSLSSESAMSEMSAMSGRLVGGLRREREMPYDYGMDHYDSLWPYEFTGY